MMALLLLEGDWLSRSEHVAHLVHRGYTLQSASSVAGEDVRPGTAPAAGVVAVLEEQVDADRASAVALGMGLPWLGWDSKGGMALAVLRLGAVMALPPEATPDDLARAVATSTVVPTGMGRPVEERVLGYRAADVMGCGGGLGA